MSNYEKLYYYNKNLLDIIEMQNPRALQDALDFNAKVKNENILEDLLDKWCGSLVKTEDGKICKITYIEIYEDPLDINYDEVDEDDIECICEEEDENITFSLKYAKENLVRKGEKR